MKPGRFFIVLLWLSIFATADAGAAAIDRSVSPSGEFVIYGADARSRGIISTAAETTKSELLALLRRRDSWTTPIVINLQSRAANLPELPSSALRFSQTGSGLKLQLDLTISREVESAKIERELLRAILLEMIYRKQTAIHAGESYVEPPAWIIEGLLASMPNRDRASLVSALSATEKIAPLAEFLGEKFELLDSTGRILYRAYAFALIEWLIDSDDGRARLGRYIDNFASAPNDPLADLRSAFPELAGNIERNWRSRIANLKRSTELLTFAESEKKLGELLHDKSVSLEDLSRKKPDRSQQLALKKLAEQLMLLSTRANPLLRPIVQEYQQLAARLALRRNHGVAAQLAELEKLRTRLSARMTEVDDYMNWFEATQLNTSSGLFDDYLKRADDTRGQRPRRRDALSVYVDTVEQEF